MKQNDNIDLGINLINKDKSEENREEECLDIIENFNDEIKDNSEISKLEMQNNENDKNQKLDENEDNIHLEIEDLDNLEIENNLDLKEVNIDINEPNNLETLTLKKPNQVYFELYKKAREKAKIAKKEAILAYLEVKNIKKTYLIDNLDDSDSEFDAEIDDVSESELEGL